VFERTREISMQKEELELQAEKIQELDKIKSRFFANISHEFRTPLTLIQGPIKKKLKETQDPKEARELNIVYQNSTRLLQLVNQLLDLSKLESGSFTLRPSKVDVVSRIRVVADGFQSLAEVKLINYKYYLPDHEVVVHLDIEKFDKIIINLLSNAFKFTPSGGEVSISLQSFAPNETYQSGYIQIEVTDTGIGIDPAHHSQVFNRFFQVDNSQTRKYDGTGIGLSITKEFIDLHQGDIKLKSNLGEGSTFVVTLPRLISGTTHLDNTLVDTSTTNEIHISTPSTNELPTRAEGEKILVIEDNADLRLYVKDSLSNHYQVMEAADGEEGINLAIAEVPDLIITDLMMPKTDGLQVCLTVKEDIRTSHIPVVLLTAKADIESKLEGLDTGADDYISKPFDMDELKLRIRNLIENRKKLREKYSRNFINLKPKEIDVQSTEEKFLLKITQVIEDHMSDSSFGVETFAREVAMSTAQLYRKINALTGKTPNDLIRDMRLKRASYLLNKKSGNIADVAFQVGFNNLSYFAKCFKEKYGETPSEYLKKTALL
jgi:DNA-binding response OmpR family regulator/nitrogen-specific signal transduction histidine kinase